jgi:hypothetical protein
LKALSAQTINTFFNELFDVITRDDYGDFHFDYGPLEKVWRCAQMQSCLKPQKYLFPMRFANAPT